MYLVKMSDDSYKLNILPFGTWAIFRQLREISLTTDLDASHYLHNITSDYSTRTGQPVYIQIQTARPQTRTNYIHINHWYCTSSTIL